jgi:class 3 adenylate cyclase
VRTPARILVVDDNATNVKILQTRLAADRYEVVTAYDGEEALAVARGTTPDLILLDIMMPKIDGVEVVRRLKADPAFPFTPIIMVTAMSDSKDIVAGFDAGADDYLTKPVDQAALGARVRSMLRIKALHDTVQEQAARLEGQATELAEWNATLERRVAEQVAEIERIGRLKRFFSPHVADLIVAAGTDDLLRSHRREITVVFVDLRGFTAFAEISEPEEVISVLRQYYAEIGEIVIAHEGTLERYAGDGMMIFFNDPVPIPNPAERALRMTLAVRDRLRVLTAKWRKRGHDLDFGVGIAQGYATLGVIGFEGRWDYGAIGTVTNLAARLCSDAGGNQILISQSVYAEAGDLIQVEPVRQLVLKGFHRPVPAYSVVGLRSERDEGDQENDARGDAVIAPREERAS